MIAVYVPKPDTALRADIHFGSGIVGTPLIAASDILIDYEGSVQFANVRSYADRVQRAASRHASKYPTIARRVAQVADLIEVGEFDGDAVYIYPDRFTDLAAWLGIRPMETLDPHELHCSAATASDHGNKP